MTTDCSPAARSVVFISKATPDDDEFVLWLAPRLEAAGYTVFADILTLDAGDRWRNVLADALYTRAIKMLLCCSDATLAKEGVREEIGIALDLVKQLKDSFH
jgi:TIR domain